MIRFFTSAFAGLHGVIFVGGVRVRWSGHVGHTGRDRGLIGGVLFFGVLSVRFVQRLHDQVQHEVSLGELFAGAERLALQMTLDALEEFFGDLECHRSAFFSHLNAAFLIFDHVVVFLDEICDVLAGKLTVKAILFIVLALYADEIVNIALTIGGTPYTWILSSELPSLDFASFNSVLLTIIGVCANGGVALIVLILTLILAWNYIKLLFEAAERYVLLGVLVYTAPVAFAMGASQSTANIFKSWCRMFGGQIFLLLMNAWCLRLFITMVGTFISNPLSM